MKQDLRYAVRQMRRNPGFSAAVIVTLALGIGGTTAVFSVLQAVLLAPLPYEEAGPTRALLPAGARQARHASTTSRARTFRSLREQAASFEAVTALANYRETAARSREGRPAPSGYACCG